MQISTRFGKKSRTQELMVNGEYVLWDVSRRRHRRYDESLLLIPYSPVHVIYLYDSLEPATTTLQVGNHAQEKLDIWSDLFTKKLLASSSRLSFFPYIFLPLRLSFPGIWFTTNVIAWFRILFRIIASTVVIIGAIAWAFGSGCVSGLLHWAISICRSMHRTLSLQAKGDIHPLVSLLLYIMLRHCR